MANATLPATLNFHQTELHIIDHDGNPWITAADLARALGYKNVRSVTEVFKRNEDEFTDNMSVVLKLSTTGQIASNTRIFSTRGCHLIAMFARTPLAKEFRRWVLDVLDKLPKPTAYQAMPPAPYNPNPDRKIKYPESFHSLSFRALVVVHNGEHVQTVGLEPDAMAISPAQIPELIRSMDISPIYWGDILTAASEMILQRHRAR